MIDFRYHLVSLVSVFLALAVGVVLGAGPLRGQIAETLNSQVDLLRGEKDQLRADLTVAEKGVENRDTFARQVLPDLVEARLTGRTVAVVVLPGADRDAVEPLVTALTAAGATVTGQVEPKFEWTDPEADASRRAASRKLGPVMTPLGLPSEVDAALARALLTTSALPVTGSAAENDPVSEQIFVILADEGLLDVSKKPVARAEHVVVLAPGVELDSATATPYPTVTVTSPTSRPSRTASPRATSASGRTAQGSAARLLGTPPATTAGSAAGTPDDTAKAASARWAALALELDRGGRGAVVSGPASSAESTGVLDAVRGDGDLADYVSTIDTLGNPMGDVLTVMALQEQFSGGSGAYGFGKGAAQPVPDIGLREVTP